MSRDDIKSLVQEKFSEPQKCGHCDRQTTPKFLEGEKEKSSSPNVLVVGYSCPGAYLSRIIFYGDSVDQLEAKEHVQKLVGADQTVMDEDIRVATRYARDLGIDPGSGDKVMMAAFWTQNYRRSKTDDPHRQAAFVCTNCNSIFSQPLNGGAVLCEACRTT
jgi:hypothetical protein